jgi:hypothetical protein
MACIASSFAGSVAALKATKVQVSFLLMHVPSFRATRVSELFSYAHPESPIFRDYFYVFGFFPGIFFDAVLRA